MQQNLCNKRELPEILWTNSAWRIWVKFKELILKDEWKFAKILRKKGTAATQNRIAMIQTYTIMFGYLEKERR